MADKLDFIVSKYELVVKNIEFLDSYVPKALAVYATFVAVTLVNTEKISREPMTAIFFVVFFFTITITLFFLLRRISFLVLQQKETAREIEKRVQVEHDLSLFDRALPEDWEKGFSTACITRWSLAVMLTIVVCTLMYSTFFGQQPPPAP